MIPYNRKNFPKNLKKNFPVATQGNFTKNPAKQFTHREIDFWFMLNHESTESENNKYNLILVDFNKFRKDF